MLLQAHILPVLIGSDRNITVMIFLPHQDRPWPRQQKHSKNFTDNFFHHKLSCTSLKNLIRDTAIEEKEKKEEEKSPAPASY